MTIEQSVRVKRIKGYKDSVLFGEAQWSQIVIHHRDLLRPERYQLIRK